MVRVWYDLKLYEIKEKLGLKIFVPLSSHTKYENLRNVVFQRIYIYIYIYMCVCVCVCVLVVVVVQRKKNKYSKMNWSANEFVFGI